MEQTEDSLLNAVKRAISEVDIVYLRTKHKETQTEYDEEGKKPVAETVREWETLEECRGSADTAKLKGLTEILSKLKESTAAGAADGDAQGTGVVLLPEVKSEAEEDGTGGS